MSRVHCVPGCLHTLLASLFFYCALRAHGRCKRFTNTLLHNITRCLLPPPPHRPAPLFHSPLPAPLSPSSTPSAAGMRLDTHELLCALQVYTDGDTASERSWSFCQKCRWQVTAKHTRTLRMWLLNKHGKLFLFSNSRMNTMPTTQLASCSCENYSDIRFMINTGGNLVPGF